MHNKFRQCLTECKALNAPALLNRPDLDTSITADKILYTHAIQMVKTLIYIFFILFFFIINFSSIVSKRRIG